MIAYYNYHKSATSLKKCGMPARVLKTSSLKIQDFKRGKSVIKLELKT